MNTVTKFKKILNRTDKPCLSYTLEIGEKYFDITLVQSSDWVNIQESGKTSAIGCHLSHLEKTLVELKRGLK